MVIEDVYVHTGIQDISRFVCGGEPYVFLICSDSA